MVHEVRHGVEGEDDCGEEDTTESRRVSVSCNDDEGQTRIIYIGWYKKGTAIFDQTKPLYLTNQNSLYFCVNQ